MSRLLVCALCPHTGIRFAVAPAGASMMNDHLSVCHGVIQTNEEVVIHIYELAPEQPVE